MNVKHRDGSRPLPWSGRRSTLAGAGGFEPPYRGIKIRCLTTWLRPKRLGRLTARRPSRQQDRRRNPRHVGVKIEAYHGREVGILGYRPVGSGERAAQPPSQRVGTGMSPSREMAVGLPFPGYFPVTDDFPGFWHQEIPGFERRPCAVASILSN